LGSEIKESLEIRNLLPFSISHNKVVKVPDDIEMKIFKFGPFREIIQFVLRPHFCRKTDDAF
jgi:hypothetical protein